VFGGLLQVRAHDMPPSIKAYTMFGEFIRRKDGNFKTVDYLIKLNSNCVLHDPFISFKFSSASY